MMKKFILISCLLNSFCSWSQKVVPDLLKYYFPELETKQIDTSYSKRFYCKSYLVLNSENIDSLHILNFFNDGSILAYTTKGQVFSGKLIRTNKNLKILETSFYKMGRLYYSVLTDSTGVIERIDSSFYINGNYFKISKELYYNQNIKKKTISDEIGLLKEDFFDLRGNLIKEISYPDTGNQTIIEFFANGGIKIKAGYNMGTYNGEYYEYFENGVLKIKGEYYKGEKVGIWITYNKDGTKFKEKNFGNTLH